jgi:hypothetical protein
MDDLKTISAISWRSDCIFVPHNISYNRNQTVYNKSSPEQMLYNICSTFIKEFPGMKM